MTLKTSTYQLKPVELKKMIRERISKMSDVNNSTELETLTELVHLAFLQGMGCNGQPADIGEVESDDYMVSAAPNNGNFLIHKKLK